MTKTPRDYAKQPGARFLSPVEYGGIPEFLGRLKTRGHALMANGVKISCWEKMEYKEISVQYQVGCSGSGNGRWNCVRDCSRKRVQQVM